MIILNEIKGKDQTRRAKTYPGQVLKGHRAEITPGVSIRIYREDGDHSKALVAFDKTFKIGEEAECDSYNLRYTGIITKIGPKTVTIQAYPGTHSQQNHQLSIFEFSWRNWDFDAVKIAKYNAEEMKWL